jgi:hypothetical protein
MDLDAKFPAKLHDLLFSDARYRVAYGGRGAAKSWNFARALLLLGIERPPESGGHSRRPHFQRMFADAASANLICCFSGA